MYELPNNISSNDSDSGGAVVVVLVLGVVLVLVVVVIFNPIRTHLAVFIPIFYVLYKSCSLFVL